MHDGMQCNPIQGLGHEPLKVRNPFSHAIFSTIYNDSCELTSDFKLGHNI